MCGGTPHPCLFYRIHEEACGPQAENLGRTAKMILIMVIVYGTVSGAVLSTPPPSPRPQLAFPFYRWGNRGPDTPPWPQRWGWTLTDTAVILHLEARGTDAAEGALKVLASAWQAGSHEAETLIGVCGEEEEGSQHQPVTGVRLGLVPARMVTA